MADGLGHLGTTMHTIDNDAHVFDNRDQSTENNEPTPVDPITQHSPQWISAGSIHHIMLRSHASRPPVSGRLAHIHSPPPAAKYT